jgi:hypothetical protein
MAVGELHAAPAPEPTGQRTERESDLGGKGHVCGHADQDAERQPDRRADRDCNSDAQQSTCVISAEYPWSHKQNTPPAGGVLWGTGRRDMYV